jgi:hypothetical protein
VAEVFELATDCLVIVDFAVECDYDFAIGADHRLFAAGEVDNFQTDRAEGDETAFEHTLLVWSAMGNRFIDPVRDSP